jgi:hypothetical protein
VLHHLATLLRKGNKEDATMRDPILPTSPIIL